MAFKHLPNDFNVRVGSKIKKKRIELRLSRPMLGTMAQINHKFLHDIESGKNEISAETLYKIKKALNISSDLLLDE